MDDEQKDLVEKEEEKEEEKNETDTTPEKDDAGGEGEKEEGEKGKVPKQEEEEFEPEARTKETPRKNEDAGKVIDKEEDNEIAPEDEKVIGKVVEEKLKAYSSIKEDVQKMKDQVEVDAFIQSEPKYVKYRAIALKYMSHPAYNNIPVKNIMAIVASNDQQKLGAEKERDAQKKVADTQGAGSTVRKPGTKKDWLNAPTDEFLEQKAKVLGHQG